MSQREYAKHRGVSEAAVRTAIKSGRILIAKKDGQKNLIDSEQADKLWEQYTNHSKKRNTPDSIGADKENFDVVSLNKSKAKKEEFNAKLAELKYLEQSGQLIKADEVVKVVTKQCDYIRH